MSAQPTEHPTFGARLPAPDAVHRALDRRCEAKFPASDDWCVEKCPPPDSADATKYEVGVASALSCEEDLCECTKERLKEKKPFGPCLQILREDGSCPDEDDR